MTRKQPTVADLRALKGKGQLTMLRVFTLDEAAAAEEAGIDIVSVPPDLCPHPDYREVAPTLFSMTGVDHRRGGNARRLPALGGQDAEAGADAIYCSGGLGTVRFLARRAYSGRGSCRPRALARHLDGRFPRGGQDGRCGAGAVRRGPRL